MCNSSANVQCPYYKYDRALKVYCEGGVHSLKVIEDKQILFKNFCTDMKNWKNCSMSVILNDYYERTEEIS